MGTQFTDSEGRAWSVAVTVGSIVRVKKNLLVDIAQPIPIGEDAQQEIKPGDPLPLLAQLASDTLLLASVLWWIIQPQAEAHSCTEDQFLDALDGDHLKLASQAFWSEYESFFRKAGVEPVAQMIAMNREMMETGFSKMSEALKDSGESAYETITRIVDGVQEEIEKARAEQVLQTSGEKSGTVPVS